MLKNNSNRIKNIIIISILIALVLGGLLFIRNYTGFATFNNSISFDNSNQIKIDRTFTQNETIPIEIGSAVSSLKINGILNGRARIILVNGDQELVIYDNKNISKIINLTRYLGRNNLTNETRLINFLEYENNSQWDENNDGIESTKGVVDISVKNSYVEGLNQEKIATIWNLFSIDNNNYETVCFGNYQACSIAGYKPSTNDWNDTIYIYIGKYGATENNIISAKLIYLDISSDSGVKYIESGWQDSIAVFKDSISILDNECIETCSIDNFENMTHELIVEIENGSELNLSTISFTIASSNSKNLTNNYTVGILEEPENISGRVIVGEPVKWVKKTTVLNGRVFLKNIPTNVTIKLNDTEIKDSKVRIKVGNIERVLDDYEIEKEILLLEKKNSTDKSLVNKQNTLKRRVAVRKAIRNLLKVPTITGNFIKGITSDYTPENSTNETVLIFENINDGEEVTIEYYTEAPKAYEENLTNGKRVIISSDVHYENILAFAEITDLDLSSIVLYYITDGERLKTNFEAFDNNNNGLVDYIEWNVPHLSNATYEIIIITKAYHLDINRIYMFDIFNQVKSRDDVWTNPILTNEYIRVVFEKNLTNKNDITIYARSNNSAIVEVYEKDSDVKIADFGTINQDKSYQIFLNELKNSQDTFDLRIVDGLVEFDYIVDPPNASISIEVIYPSGDTWVASEKFFKVEVNVTCNFGDCGYVNVSLDPEEYETVVYNVTGSTNFEVPIGVTEVKVLVVGGGGSAGTQASTSTATGSGGGGAGGLTYNASYPVSAGEIINITVGAGGTAPSSAGAGNDGGSSSFGNISVSGGGGGGYRLGGGRAGGSGGGGGYGSTGGTGIAGQGYKGGDNTNDYGGAGGGGANATGVDGNGNDGKNGGDGIDYSSIFGTDVGDNGWFAGGGGGGGRDGYSPGSGGQGGGGNGAVNANGNPAMDSTGGGGGGSGDNSWIGGDGGDGIVIIKYLKPKKSGLIPTDSGTPFYTNESNPRTTQYLNENDSQVITFWVNASGTGSNHQFYAFANLTSNMSISNITSTWNVSIDSTPAELNITTPLNITYYQTDIYFNISSNENISTCRFTLDGWSTSYTMNKINATEFYYLNNSMIDKYHYAQFLCNETTGLEVTKGVYFTIDVEGPNASLKTPTNLSYKNETSYQMIFNASDKIGLKNATLNIYNSTLNLINQTLINISGTDVEDGVIFEFAQDGIYYWNYRVFDLAGNYIDTENYTIIIDTTNPSIDYESDTEMDNTNVSQTWIFVNVSVYDVNFDNITYYLYNDLLLFNLVNKTTNYAKVLEINWTSLVDDQYFYNVSVYDKAGNLNWSQTRAIKLDTAAPLVSTIYPLPVQYGYNITQLNYSVSDELLDSCWYSINDTSNISVECNGSISTLLSNGEYNWTIYANDTLGHISYDKVSFGINTLLPVVSISNPQNRTYDHSITSMNFSASDSDLDQCWYSLNGAPNVTTDCSLNITGINSVEEGNKWYIYANDSIGGIAYQYVSFTVDSTSPKITIVSPENITYYPESIDFHITSNEPLDSCKFSIDNWNTNYSMTKINSTFYFYTMTTIIEGDYIAKYSCNDSIGNINSTESINFSAYYPQVNISLVYPLQEINVTRSGTFNISYNITCEDYDCGNINVTLDPTQSWWNTSYIFRKASVINGTTAGAQTNYVMQYIVHYGAGTDFGKNVYCNNSCQTDFDDIRFTNETGSLLDYFLEEKIDSDKASFWVEIDSIPVSPSNATIYIYYGNNDTTTTSNGEATFLMFEGFEGTHELTSNSGTTITQEAGGISGSFMADVNGDANYAVAYNASTDFARGTHYFEAYMMYTSSTTIPIGLHFCGQNTGDNGYQIIIDDRNSGDNPMLRKDISTSGATHGEYFAGANNWIFVRGYANASTFYGDFYDNTFNDTAEETWSNIESSYTSGSVGVFAYQDGGGKVDNLRVRKRANPEPTQDVMSFEKYTLVKGIVSNIYGTNPFYTINNPRIINLNRGESQIVTFWVNVTGEPSTHPFYAYVKLLSNSTFSDVSEFVNITIKNPNISLSYPINDEVYLVDILFNFTIDDGNIDTCKLWGNWSGSWSIKQSLDSVAPGIENVYASEDVGQNGDYKWKVSCNDTFGNSIESTEEMFSVNTSVFVLSIVSPLNTSYVGTSIDFNVSSNSLLSTCKFSLDNWLNNYSMTKFNNTYFNYTNSSMNIGSYTAQFWCNNTDDIIKTKNVSFTIVYKQPDPIRFIVKNSSDDNVASIDRFGYLYLRGNYLENQVNLVPPPNSFIIQNKTGHNIAYINSTGDLVLTGTVTEVTTMATTGSNVEFRNSTDNLVAFFDSKGNLKLKGQKVQNYENP